MRRFTLTVGGGSVTGCRDLTVDDLSEYNRDKSDNEAVGDEVRMSEGPFDIAFEMLAENGSVASGYIDTMVAVGKEITRNGATEESADVTYTLEQGHFKVGRSLNTDTPGRVRVTGQFKTLVKS
jgi:hypothetical protein